MKKKLLAAVIMSLAMAAPQVKAEPSALEQALNDPNVEKFLLPSDQSISADLPITSERLFELNDFDTPTGDNYYNIIGNGHSGFGDNSNGVYDLTNVQSISGFNTKASASNPNGDGGAFFLDDDSCLVVLSNNFDADKKPLMTAIANNTAAGKGGAIYANYNWGGGVYLANTNVLENTAGDKGGGLYLDWGINKIVALPGTNVVIADNKAVIGGQLVDNDIYLYSPRKQQNSGGIRGTLSLVTSSTVEDPSSSVPTGTGRIYVGDLRAEGSSDIRIGSSSNENSAIGHVMIENLMLDNDAMFSTQNVSPDSKTSIYIPELTMSRDSIINTVNGYIDDNLHIIDISLDNSNNKFMVDASLMNGNTVIDHFGTISGGTGKLLVNIIGSDTTSGSVRLSSGTTSTATFADSTTQYGGSKYVFTQDPNDKGIINYQATKERSITLQYALQDYTATSYEMPDLYVADSNLGLLHHYYIDYQQEPPEIVYVDRTFTINGNNGVLMAGGADISGIEIPQQYDIHLDPAVYPTPKLNINNLEGFAGFTKRASAYTAAEGGAILAEKAVLNIDNVTFANNMATGTKGADIDTFGMGGAIYLATPDEYEKIWDEEQQAWIDGDHFKSVINNSTFVNNKTVAYGNAASIVDGGGAIYAKGDLDITNSLFNNNSAISNIREGIAEGGALYYTANSDGGMLNRDLNIINSMFMGNTAGDVLNDEELISTEGLGGAILLSRADANIVGSTFVNNTAHAAEFYNGYTNVKGKAQGGAIYIDKWTTTAPYEINITDSTFAMNTAEAVKSEDNGDGTYTLTTEGANQSQAYGGAIAIMTPSGSAEKMEVNIDGSDFLANKSGNGGAIYNYGATVNISNSSFNANTANHYYVDDNPRWNQDMGGGAIYNDWGVMNLDNVTFAGNYAKQITYDGDTPIVSMVKNDIRNDKTLNFVGKASTLDGGIYGSGRTYFNLDEGELMNIGANTSIVQSTFEVNSGIVNIANADNITARGGFTVGENGVLGIESGTMVIDNKYFKEIENSGVILNGGTLDVTGEDLYGSKVTNNATGMFMNSGTVKAAEIINDGVFSNSDTGSITGDITNSENAIFNNEGIIAGNIANAGIFAGTLNNDYIFVNDGYVTANLTNNEDGVVVNNSVILNGLTNAGSFANTIGSVIDTTGEEATVTTVANSGNMINAGDILATTFSNSGTFLNGYNPSNVDEVIQESSIVATNINNSGLMVNAGVLSGKVKNNAGDLINSGTILGDFTNYSFNGVVENSGTIIGDVENYYSADSFINNGSITGDVVNNGDGFVNAGIITGNVENNGGLTEVEFTNYGTIDGNLTNSGNMLSNGKITGDVDNSGTLASKLDDIGGTINMSWSTAELELLDNGITFNESNKSKIQGNKGTLSLYGDIISDAVLDYTGKINLNSGATVTKGENGDAFQSAQKIILNSGVTATLNTLNGVADALTYADMVIDTGADSTLRLEMDWNDSLTAGGSLVAGDVEISKLDLSNVADGDKTTIITDTIGSKVAIKDIDLITTKGNANSVSYVYHAGTVTTPGYGELTAAKIPSLATIINTTSVNDDEDAYYNYAMETSESGSSTIPVIGHLKVNGNGNAITTKGLLIGDTIDTGNVILRDTNISNVTSIPGAGAILLNNGSTLTIRADEHDVSVSGTTGANKTAIYMATGAGDPISTVMIEANNGHTVTINDDIRSNNQYNRVFFNNGNINMNGVLDPLTAVNTGANVTRGGQDAAIQWQLFGGNLKYLSDSYLNNPSALNSVEFSGGTLDLMNGAATTIALNTLTLSNDSNLFVDADLAAEAMDKFTFNGAVYNGGTLHVAGINLLSDSKKDTVKINVVNDALLLGNNYIDYTGSTALSRVFKYNVAYNDGTGDFEFNRMATGSYKDYNPGVLAAPIAAQLGGYLNQLNSYEQAFMNMDTYMMMPKNVRTALKMRNKIASLQNAEYDDTKSLYDYNAGWFRPYATFENVPLHNGPRVSNVMYGSYFGGESALKDLGHGWDGMWGAYIGYNGSHQAYDGVGIYQNGGTLGLTGMAYKGNYFVGGTVNVGAAGAEASTAFGSDDFAMLMTGAALKTGYNWELANGKFIIQPNLMASYSFVNTFNSRSSSGVAIESDPLHAITIEPGVKFIGNLKNGWQPYAGISMVFNIMDRTRFQANDVSLPNFSINPFVRYGVGVRKTWGDRLTGHFQTYFTNGGRNGVGLSAGFRFAIGKDGSNEISGKTPELKKTQIKLSSMK